MPKISKTILKGHFAHKGGPIITLKNGVAIAMVSSLGILTLILFAGLLLPKSVLVKLSNNTSSQPNGSSAVNDGAQAVNQDKTQQQQATEASGTTAPTTTGTTTPSTAPTTPANTTTPPAPTTPATGGTTAVKVAPTLIFTGSPTSVSSGGSVTLSWSINAAATAPVTCTATGGSFAGTKATSGSQAVTVTATTSFTVTCTNAAGTSGAKTVTISVAAPVVSCGAGGTCSASDIAQHATNGNCWVGVTGTGFNKVYVITSSFNSSHVSSAGKNAASSTRTCGKVISIGTLRGFDGGHSSGSSAKIGGNTFDAWLASFYYANYQ